SSESLPWGLVSHARLLQPRRRVKSRCCAPRTVVSPAPIGNNFRQPETRVTARHSRRRSLNPHRSALRPGLVAWHRRCSSPGSLSAARGGGWGGGGVVGGE